MADENNCCTCTTPKITIKLNKQGPQGVIGPQGNPGFSPVITVEEDTSTNYKLNIQTEQGSFITPNLKGSIPAGGSAGSVLTRTESGGAEFTPLPFASTDKAGIVMFATQKDVDDGETGLAITSDVIRNYYTKTQTDGKYVDLTSQQEITGRKDFYELRTNTIAERGGNGYISYQRDSIDSNLNSVTIGGASTPNVYINRGGLIGTNIDSNNIGSYALTSLPIASTTTLGGVKVDGTTIVIDSNGVISSQGGGSSYTAGNGIDITNDEISIDTSVVATKSDISNMVTLDTTQVVTGGKRFKQTITFDIGNLISAEDVFPIKSYMCSRIPGNDTYIGVGNILTYRYPLQSEQGILEIGSTGGTNYNGVKYYYAGKLRLVAPEVLTRYDGTNEYEILDENNITTNTTISNLTSRISTLENTITNLTNRITALETAINGGNA